MHYVPYLEGRFHTASPDSQGVPSGAILQFLTELDRLDVDLHSLYIFRLRGRHGLHGTFFLRMNLRLLFVHCQICCYQIHIYGNYMPDIRYDMRYKGYIC